MSTDTKKMIERIPLEVLNNGNFALLDELVATDFVDRSRLSRAPRSDTGRPQAVP